MLILRLKHGLLRTALYFSRITVIPALAAIQCPPSQE